MCSMNKPSIIIILFFLSFTAVLSAQENVFSIDTLDENTTKKSFGSYDEQRTKLLSTEIPPLDTLFASARINNARILMSEMETEVAIRNMKTEQRNWWSYLRAFGTYQYGVMASLVDISQGGNPVNPQYSQQAQSWWNLGISLNIPFEDLFDRPNQIKREQARVRAAQYNVEIKFDELKNQIAEAYAFAILSLTLSRALADRYNYAKTQYEVCERNFLIGKVTSLELTNAKGQEVEAYVELQKELSNLIRYASTLETLSKIPILYY